MEKARWNVEKIPDYFLEFINMSVPDPEFDELWRMAIKSKLMSPDGEPDPMIEEQLSKKTNEMDKQENHVKGNPLKYATMVKAEDGTDLYLDRENFLRVMKRFPLNIWINDRPPYESPIAARSFGQKIIVCPFERDAKITAVYSDWRDITFEEINTHNPKEEEGIVEISLHYYPTKYGVDYSHLDFKNRERTRERTTTKEDHGLRLELLLKHSPSMLKEEF